MIFDLNWITLEEFLTFSKGIFIFSLLVVVGGLVSKFVRSLVERVLKEKLKLDELMKKQKLDDSVGYMSLSEIIATMMMWLVFLIFVREGASALYLGSVGTALEGLVSYMPRIIAAIIIGIIGLIGADWITDRITQGKGKMHELIAVVVKPLVIFFAFILAGEQLGFELGFLQNVLTYSIIGIVWGIALAIGLAVGLGYGLDNKKVPEIVDKFWKKANK